MTPRPLYKWKSFWLGLFVACFLAWAWWDSYRVGSIAQVGWDSRMFMFANCEGEAFVTFKRYPGSQLEINGTREEAEVVSELRSEEWFMGVSLCRIRDALVFFSFVGLWGGWLFWRWKREAGMLRA